MKDDTEDVTEDVTLIKEETNGDENTKKVPRRPSGLFVVNKSAGMTSHDVVAKVRKLYGTRQVGHTGTLDPMATGVLLVLVGNAVKASEYIMEGNKRYRAKMRLGVVSDTEDITGKLSYTGAPLPPPDRVYAACASFTGEINQVPPMYSAIKKDGKKLYELARKGEVTEREARRITVFSLNARETGRQDEYELEIFCSKGTYIRTLCADIGNFLGCGAVMSALERTQVCDFGIEQSLSLSETEETEPEKRQALLVPTEMLFYDLPALTLEGFFLKLAKNGACVYQKKLNTVYPPGQRVRLYEKNESGKEFFALGEIADYPDGSAVKPIKFFCP